MRNFAKFWSTTFFTEYHQSRFPFSNAVCNIFFPQNNLFLVWYINVTSYIKKQSPGGVPQKGVLKNFTIFTGKKCDRLYFSIKLQAQACNFIKKETLVQVFSCEFYETSKNIFSYGTPPVAASLFSVFLSLDQNLRKTIMHLTKDIRELSSLNILDLTSF